VTYPSMSHVNMSVGTRASCQGYPLVPRYHPAIVTATSALQLLALTLRYLLLPAVKRIFSSMCP
jgi:hypothetical protein